MTSDTGTVTVTVPWQMALTYMQEELQSARSPPRQQGAPQHSLPRLLPNHSSDRLVSLQCALRHAHTQRWRPPYPLTEPVTVTVPVTVPPRH